MPKATPLKTKDGFVYEFPATCGIQSGKAYYLCMLPIPLLGKIFRFDDPTLPIEARMQRKPDPKKANEIADYIIENRKNFVIPPLTASIDGEIEFISTETKGVKLNIGTLRIDIASRFLINDGQHRLLGISKAFDIDPSLAYESIGVTLFLDIGLHRAQQIFADINKNAKATDPNITLAFNHRDKDAILTREVIRAVPFLARYTQNEGAAILKTGNKLFLRKWVNETNQKISDPLRVNQRIPFCVGFWNALIKTIPEWHQLNQETPQIQSNEVRVEYVSGLAVTLKALALVGDQVAMTNKADAPEQLTQLFEPLSQLDWHKTNPIWENSIIDAGTGKVITAKSNLMLLTTFLMSKIKNRV